MKIKIFALILAVCCLSSLFVSCKADCETHTDADNNGKCDVCDADYTPTPCETHTDADNNLVCDVCTATITPPCNPHKDENADKICDACGGAVVVIVEQLAPEAAERVDMVVNAIPENVAIGEYINTKPVGNVALTKVEEIDGYIEDRYGTNIYTVTEATDGDYSVYKVYDVVSGKVVCTADDKYTGNDGSGTKYVYVNLNSAYVEVVITVGETINAEYVETRTKNLYTYSGELFYTETIDEGTFKDVEFAYGTDYNVEYVVIDDTIYLIDIEDSKLIHKQTVDTFVDRPTFDHTTENYGYIYTDSTVYVYDLSAWINCVYSYTVPSYCYDVSSFYLENGNVLIQSKVELENNAVSYDLYEYGQKVDVVYTLINVAEKTASNIEFGYYISYVDNDPSEELFTDKALNIATVYPIVENSVDSNSVKYLIVDNTLQILFDVESAFDYSDTAVVGENLFCLRLTYNYGEFVYEVVNDKGEHVSYIPLIAEMESEYVKLNNKLYNYKMELIVDLADYNNWYIRSEYVILRTDEGELYYLDFSANAGVKKIELEDAYVVDVYGYGYVLSYLNGDTGNTEYALYNADGSLVYKSEAYIYSIYSISEDDTAYLMNTEDGFFIVK